MTAFQAVLLSLTNLTSAGQFAGLGIITAASSYTEMAFTQLVINLRYCLMSCALSQKLDRHSAFFTVFSLPTAIRTKFLVYAAAKKANWILSTATGPSAWLLPGGPSAPFWGLSPEASCRAGSSAPLASPFTGCLSQSSYHLQKAAGLSAALFSFLWLPA